MAPLVDKRRLADARCADCDAAGPVFAPAATRSACRWRCTRRTARSAAGAAPRAARARARRRAAPGGEQLLLRHGPRAALPAGELASVPLRRVRAGVLARSRSPTARRRLRAARGDDYEVWAGRAPTLDEFRAVRRRGRALRRRAAGVARGARLRRGRARRGGADDGDGDGDGARLHVLEGVNSDSGARGPAGSRRRRDRARARAARSCPRSRPRARRRARPSSSCCGTPTG